MGRTKNFDRRMKSHNRPGSRTAGLDVTIKIDNLDYTHARGIEQLGMFYYNTDISQGGLNRIRGISPTNPNGVQYTLAGFNIGNYLYNQIDNQILNWREWR